MSRTRSITSITSWRAACDFTDALVNFRVSRYIHRYIFDDVADVRTPTRSGIMYKPHSTMLVHTALKSISTSFCLQPTSRRSCHSPFADRPGIFVLSDRDNHIREMHIRESSRPRNFDDASASRFAKTNANTKISFTCFS